MGDSQIIIQNRRIQLRFAREEDYAFVLEKMRNLGLPLRPYQQTPNSSSRIPNTQSSSQITAFNTQMPAYGNNQTLSQSGFHVDIASCRDDAQRNSSTPILLQLMTRSDPLPAFSRSEPAAIPSASTTHIQQKALYSTDEELYARSEPVNKSTVDPNDAGPGTTSRFFPLDHEITVSESEQF